MSTMNAELHAALRDAGASAEKAEAAAVASPSAEQVPTKTEFAVEIASFRTELRAMRWYFAVLLTGMVLVIGVLFQMRGDVSDNAATIRQLQIVVNENAAAIEQNRRAIEQTRLAIEENRAAIEEIRQGIEENGRQIQNVRVIVEDIRNPR